MAPVYPKSFPMAIGEGYLAAREVVHACRRDPGCFIRQDAFDAFKVLSNRELYALHGDVYGDVPPEIPQPWYRDRQTRYLIAKISLVIFLLLGLFWRRAKRRWRSRGAFAAAGGSKIAMWKFSPKPPYQKRPNEPDIFWKLNDVIRNVQDMRFAKEGGRATAEYFISECRRQEQLQQRDHSTQATSPGPAPISNPPALDQKPWFSTEARSCSATAPTIAPPARQWFEVHGPDEVDFGVQGAGSKTAAQPRLPHLPPSGI